MTLSDLPHECQQQSGETKKAHAAFLDYCRMGPGRSLAKLHREYTEVTPETERPPTRHLRTLKEWSRTRGWQERVAVWDGWQQAKDQEMWERRRADLRERDWQQGQKLRDRVEEILDQLPVFIQQIKGEAEGTRVITTKLRASLTQISQALKAASELQRLALGEPTENVKHSGVITFIQAVPPSGGALNGDDGSNS